MARALTLPQAMQTTAGRLMVWAQTTPGVWTLWGVTRAALLFNLILGQHYCDPQFYQYAGDVAVGRWPYQAVPVEYPPLAILLMVLPALPLLPFAGIAPRPEANPHPLHPDPVRYGAYGVSFGIMLLAVDALTLWGVGRVARRWRPGDATGARASILYILLVLGSGALLQKFDLATGALCLGALWALWEDRDALAWGSLALATLTKGFPALLLPLLILARMRGGVINWAALRRGALGGAVASLLLVGPTLLLGGVGPLIQSVTYHTMRGTEIESVQASVMLALAWLPRLHVYTTFNPADLSRDIHSPLAGPVGYVGLLALAFVTLWVYALQWRLIRRPLNASKPVAWAQAQGSLALLLLLGFALTFRALPVHYLLAIIPLAAVTRLPEPWQGRWLALLAGTLVASQIVITIWHALVRLEPGPDFVLIVRNVLLVAASVTLARGASASVATIAPENG
jgi:hypothetical protein